jgi:hypothetical protein
MSSSQPGTVRPTPRRKPVSTRRQPIPAPRVIRRRVTIYRVSPWSVLKLSLIFYFCLLLVGMVAATVLWSLLVNLDIVSTVVDMLAEFRIKVQPNAGNAARLLFLIGLVNVVLWSAVNVLMAFLYNLIADLIGGLRITLSEDEATSEVATAKGRR